MEINMLSGHIDGTVDRTVAPASCLMAATGSTKPLIAAPSSQPRRDAVSSHAGPATDAHLLRGVGTYRVPASWQLDAPVIGAVRGPITDQQDPKFSTRMFSTRQGPPTCSPPV